MEKPEQKKIYIPVLDEETPSVRGTQAEVLDQNEYMVLAEPYYKPEDEIWQFPPGTIVRCEERENFGERILLAVEQIKSCIN